MDEYLPMLDYVLFLGYNPGWAGQDIQPEVFRKIARFSEMHPNTLIAVDGHVSKETIPDFVRAGARILCANTAVFGEGNPVENVQQLTLMARAEAT